MAAHRTLTWRGGDEVWAVADVADPEVMGNGVWVIERHGGGLKACYGRDAHETIVVEVAGQTGESVVWTSTCVWLAYGLQ